MKGNIICITLGLLLGWAAAYSVDVYYSTNQASDQCVADLINLGFERADIVTTEGSCHLWINN